MACSPFGLPEGVFSDGLFCFPFFPRFVIGSPMTRTPTHHRYRWDGPLGWPRNQIRKMKNGKEHMDTELLL